MSIQYQTGIPEELRGEAAVFYDEAFGEKFALAVTMAAASSVLMSLTPTPERDGCTSAKVS